MISVLLFGVSSALIASFSELKQECSKPVQKSYSLAAVSSNCPKQQVLQGDVLLTSMKNEWQRDKAEPLNINVETSAKNTSKEVETDLRVLQFATAFF